ncbi:hypothetical protein [Zunongwangia pacifica]|uniref:Uncharacterized protein n=1 Tax=Zunongwangia pacifica TaxID=2911062 RepID=A0A9X1ZX27_9FLAO|nr:hypothetical protein [Zunongwangia pacifica]MCL6220750.1 hypothetical protein [Zunongwangia pacifica]
MYVSQHKYLQPFFIFKKSLNHFDYYKLPTLKEVQEFIEKEGHLQGVPSAKEVKEEGLMLGEINAKLLQKIEELTLYTIEQEIQLKKQQELLNNQESREIELQKKLLEQQESLKSLLKRIEILEQE